MLETKIASPTFHFLVPPDHGRALKSGFDFCIAVAIMHEEMIVPRWRCGRERSAILSRAADGAFVAIMTLLLMTIVRPKEGR